ncbi:hypothetical protein Q0812_03725 [Brevundimonas sp. 2R-24]|uniref:Lipoprotein n=1 Tax=Peiella sedimenti TaxID=3061083 RepID=A0ABT8SIX9_9CAUL|nr:hypothetical protein [Caulobacteraceae bacterium XZ-24]
MHRNALVAAAVVLIAACSQEPAREDGSAHAPTPAPAPAEPTPADANALTAEGWGPLRIGMTRAEVEQALGGDDDPAVGGPEPEVCDQFRPARAPEGLQVMIENGRLARISLIREAALKTVDGYGLGATASELKAGLGARAVVTPHKYSQAPAEYVDVWYSQERSGDDIRLIRYEIGPDGRVSMIHAGGPAAMYVEGCA